MGALRGQRGANGARWGRKTKAQKSMAIRAKTTNHGRHKKGSVRCLSAPMLRIGQYTSLSISLFVIYRSYCEIWLLRTGSSRCQACYRMTESKKWRYTPEHMCSARHNQQLCDSVSVMSLKALTGSFLRFLYQSHWSPPFVSSCPFIYDIQFSVWLISSSHQRLILGHVSASFISARLWYFVH